MGLNVPRGVVNRWHATAPSARQAQASAPVTTTEATGPEAATTFEQQQVAYAASFA